MVKINPLSKPIWKYESDVKLCSLLLKRKEFGKIRAEVSHLRDDHYATNLFSQNGERLGKEFWGLYPQDKRIFLFNIETAKDYRKIFRIGELLRLISIMEMFENKIEKMQLYSKETAVYFHSKYNFKPEIRQFEQRDKTLEVIAGDNTFEDLQMKADFLQKNIKECKTSAGLRELCCMAAELTAEYLERVKNIPSESRKSFGTGIDMCLQKENILQEKDKYNKLFEKHGIDYKI